MSEEKFTKGPWYIKQSEEIRLPYSINVSSTRITSITILDTPGGQYQSRHVIAQVVKGNGRGEANAALIAAAPEMYEFGETTAEVLQILLERLGPKPEGLNAEIKRLAEERIAEWQEIEKKARGEE